MDASTVRVHTSKPWPTFVSIMTFTQAAMYPAKAYAGKDSAFISKTPIGTGPYRFVKWSKDEEIVLEADPGHWRGSPRIKTVVFRPIPDDAVRVAALQNGETWPSISRRTWPTSSPITRSSSCRRPPASAHCSSCS